MDVLPSSPKECSTIQGRQASRLQALLPTNGASKIPGFSGVFNIKIWIFNIKKLFKNDPGPRGLHFHPFSAQTGPRRPISSKIFQICDFLKPGNCAPNLTYYGILSNSSHSLISARWANGCLGSCAGVPSPKRGLHGAEPGQNWTQSNS